MRTRLSKLLPLGILTLLPQSMWAADALNFFNNWFVTGDYVVAGVGLRGLGAKNGGLATGTINVTGVPSNGQPIAAFLYWSTVESSTTPSGANGSFNGKAITGNVLGSPNSPCAGNTGAAAGFVYRADVLRFLPVNSNNIFQANGPQTVTLPDSTKTVLYTNGASLVVIYRVVVSGLPLIAPLRAVVIYDGAYTLTSAPGSGAMTQNVLGFYQASTNPQARVTPIVANGQSGFSAPFSVNNNTLSTKPFDGALGARWDNPSYPISLAPNAASFSAMETASGSACLTWGAIIASVNVQDSDNDGLLDIWETSGLYVNTASSPAVFGTCTQYGYASPNCVPLNLMGANPFKQDIFIQMDWMYSNGYTNALGTNPPHNHIPPLSSLSQVAATFALHQINVHFDVGNNYQGAQPGYCNAQCSFIIPTAYTAPRPAQDLDVHGNDIGINENTLLCPQGTSCVYGDLPYPVLSFEFGFDSVRDGNYLLNPPNGFPAHLPGNRFWAFHYGLFAHAIGGPYNSNGTPINPTPLSYSGIAQLPGGGFMVTFGLWTTDNAYNLIGTPFEVANTIHHELGHTLGLYHGGLNPTPNCMPNYPSAMNYMYQIRGLTDANGNEQVDYSYGLLLPLSENLLDTSIPIALPGVQHYLIRYYGPVTGPLAPKTVIPITTSQAVQYHCDGTNITNGEQLVKLQGSTLSTPDWSDYNVALGKLIPPIDLNNEGTLNQVFFDQPDWFVLNLQQIGSAPNFGGISVGAKGGDTGGSTSDAGATASDTGAKGGDTGAFPNTGVSYSSNAGAVASDTGAKGGDTGELDQETVLLSGGLDPPTNLTATNTATANVLAWNPSTTGGNLTYDVFRCAGAGCTPGGTPFATGVSGGATPSFTDTVNYTAAGGTACPAGSTCPNTTYVYAVTAVAVVNGITSQSLYSNTATSEVPELFVVADNNANYNNDNTFTYNGLYQQAVYHVFGDTGPATPFAGTTLAGVTCTSERNWNASNWPASCSGPTSYPSTSPTELVTYVASGATYKDTAGTHTGGTLIINQRPITVTAAANTKTYDGTTTAAALPTYAVTIPNSVGLAAGATPLGTGDSPNFSEAYALSAAYPLPYVGTGLSLTPAGTVNDTNGGNNYSYTYTSTQNGVIQTRPVTATLTAQSKTYDSTNTEPNASMSCSLANTIAVDNVTCTPTAGTFSSTQAGASIPVTATATLGGTAAVNYTFGATAGTTVSSTSVTTLPAASPSIYTKVLTATLTSAPSKTYDGTTTETNLMTCSVATVISPPDAVTCAATNGNFTTSQNSPTSQVATATQVTATATISGTGVSNYTLGASATTVVSVTTANVSAPSSITTRAVTATLSASKVYDGTTTATQPANMSCSLNAVGTDFTSNSLTCMLSNGLFNSSQVVGATGVSATVTLGGPYATDYTLGANGTTVNTLNNVSGPASITPAQLIITASSAAPTYGMAVAIGATFNAFVNNETSLVLGPGFTCTTSYMPGNPTGNVGTNYGTSCSGAVDSNYSISYVPGVVTVSPAPLTVTATGVNKNFDGTTNATVTLSDNRQTGPAFAADTFTDAYTSASFANIGPGLGITVNVTGISISGGSGAGNYVLTSTSATTTANISDSIDLSKLSPNGSNYTPTWNGSMLQLSNSTSETTSAWLPAAIPVSSAFTTAFQFQITPPATGSNTIGDGFAFVIQSAPSPTGGSPWTGSGNTTLGTTGLGEYIGYVGIPNSIAIEFDTWYNPTEDDPPVAVNASDAHIGIQSNGASPNSANHGTAANLGGPTLYNFADGGQHTATITYDGLYTINVYVDGSLVVTGTVPSSQTLSTFLGLNGGPAYIGFTAATGAAQEVDLLGSTWTWDFSVISPPAP